MVNVYQNVLKETMIRSPVHVLSDKKTLEMETVILFVKMVIILKLIVPVPLENLLMLTVYVFLHVKMVNGTEMMKLNAHADLGNLSTKMDSVKEHAILKQIMLLQIHAHVPTVSVSPNTGNLKMKFGFIDVRDYVTTSSMVVKSVLHALSVIIKKIITKMKTDIILLAFVPGII